MMDILTNIGLKPPYAFYRSPVKNDSPDYIFDNGNVVKKGIRR